MSTAMTREERESFLADVRVALIAVDEPGRGPLCVPIWYAYEPGQDVRIITGRASRKGRLLEKAGRFSLCVQTETAPYKYVSVEGPIASIGEVELERDLRPMARRYLGDEGGDAYVKATGGDADRDGSMLVRMTPDRWLTVDYAKQFSR